MEIFNNEHLHRAISMKYPAKLYTLSTRIYQGLPDIDTNCGRICIKKKKINLSTVFAGQTVGITETDDGIWLVILYAIRSRIL